jgi:hypothetical protein
MDFMAVVIKPFFGVGFQFYVDKRISIIFDGCTLSLKVSFHPFVSILSIAKKSDENSPQKILIFLQWWQILKGRQTPSKEDNFNTLLRKKYIIIQVE